MSREEIEGRVRNEIQREINHETWRGLRVESYRFKVPIPPELRGSEWDWGYCSHWSTHPGAEPLVSLFDAAQALTALLAENERLERENADLKSSVVTFASIWAVRYARDYGLPEGHIAAEHYDLLERCGARMDSFTRNPPRAALNKDPDQ